MISPREEACYLLRQGYPFRASCSPEALVRAAGLFRLYGRDKAISALEESAVTYASLQALIYLHKRPPVVNAEKLETLSRSLLSSRPSNQARAAFTEFLVNCDDHVAAKSFSEAHLAIQDEPMLWFEIGRSLHDVGLAESALAHASKSVMTTLGFAAIASMKRDFASALAILSESNSCDVVLTEKAKCYVMLKKWEEAVEAISRVSSNFPVACEQRLIIALAFQGDVLISSTLLNSFDRMNGKIASLAVALGSSDKRVVNCLASLMDDSTDFLLPRGKLAMLEGEFAEAKKLYEAAATAGFGGVAILGLLRCRIAIEQNPDVSDEIELVNQPGTRAEALYVKALVSRNRGEFIDFSGVIDIHVANYRSCTHPTLLYTSMDPPFILELVAQLESTGEITKRTLLLEELYSYCPGLMKARLALARLRFYLEDYKGADELLEERECPESFLLRSRFALTRGDLGKARVYFDAAVGYNLALRGSAFRVLLSILTEGVTEGIISQVNAWSPRDSFTEEDGADRMKCFLHLAQFVSATGRITEAMSLIARAKDYVTKGSSELDVLRVAAKCQAQAGDFSKAREQLTFPRDHRWFVGGQLAIAQLYLKTDRRLSITAMKELVDEDTSADVLLQVGEVWLEAREPAEAICAFRLAAARSADTEIWRRTGAAFEKVHEFQTAVEFYSDILKRQDCAPAASYSVRIALARLLNRQKRWTEVLEILQGETSLDGLLLVAEAEEGSGSVSRAITALKSAAANCSNSGDRRGLADVAYKLGLALESCGSQDAFKWFEEAAKHNSADSRVLIAFARALTKNGDHVKAETVIDEVLKNKPDSEEAAVLLADLTAVSKDRVLAGLNSVLVKNPGHTGAITRLLQLLRRQGRLDEAESALLRAEITAAAGARLARGLWLKWRGDVREAQECLISARAYPPTRNEATLALIDIFLFPDEWFCSVEGLSKPPSFVNDATVLSVEMPTNLRARAMGALGTVLARKSAEPGMSALAELITLDKDNANVLFALGAANVALKSTSKAKAALKRATEVLPTYDNYESIIRSLLLLAELEDARVSMKLAARVCELDPGCSRAWELQGISAEANGSFLAAAEFYNRALNLNMSPRVAAAAAGAYSKAGDATGAVKAALRCMTLAPDSAYSKPLLQLVEKARASFRN